MSEDGILETVRIYIQTSTPEYANDFNDVLKLFFHVELFTDQPEEKDTEELIHIFDCVDGQGTSTFTFREKTYSCSAEVPENTREQALQYKRICKRLCKISLYRLLKELTGIAPPWGSLTGIRPTRLFYECLSRGLSRTQAEEYLIDTFDISQDKAHLLNRIVAQQQMLPYPKPNDIDVYLSIPFCRTRCAYCSFPGEAIGKEKQVAPYLNALFAEMKYAKEMMDKKELHLRALYIGGGTPSALNESDFDRLICETRRLFPKADEYTVEAGRPDTITEKKLQSLLDNGITRISINPQTMNDKTLKVIGRDHTAAQMIEAFELARSMGFDNINTDVIAGLPGETAADFEHTMQELLALRPDSLTVHTLAIKHSSRLNLEKWPLPDGDAASKMVQLGEEAASILNMEPYYLYRQKYMAGQQQNVGYAAKGKVCLYNVDIMEENMTIIALGAGAISKRVFPDRELRIIRQPNPKNVGQYIERLDEMIQKKMEWLS